MAAEASSTEVTDAEVAKVTNLGYGVLLTGVNVREEHYLETIRKLCAEHGFWDVVKLTSGFQPGISDPNVTVSPSSVFHFKGITILSAPVADKPDAPLEYHLACVLESMANAIKHGKVLVHCREGRSRSVAIVVAFMMWKHKLTFAEAYSIVKAKRPIVNTKFTQLLELFEDFLNSKGHYVTSQIPVSDICEFVAFKAVATSAIASTAAKP